MEKGVVSSSLDEDKGGMDVVSILAELQVKKNWFPIANWTIHNQLKNVDALTK